MPVWSSRVRAFRTAVGSPGQSQGEGIRVWRLDRVAALADHGIATFYEALRPEGRRRQGYDEDGLISVDWLSRDAHSEAN
jgi:hypothetical protein